MEQMSHGALKTDVFTEKGKKKTNPKEENALDKFPVHSPLFSEALRADINMGSKTNR